MLIPPIQAGLSLALCLAFSVSSKAQDFVNFESPSIHPISIATDGTRLFAVNTPDNRLAIYSVTQQGNPILLREVFVGLEPVSVRPRTKDEVWVVNYLSDSVSVVDINKGVVTATLRVVDEPADVVFAAGKAFVSAAGSDAICVFDATTHQDLGRIDLLGDEPRNLVASPDGKTVWAVVHRSGNETTILEKEKAPPQPPPTNTSLPAPPQVGLIIDSEDPTWINDHDVDLPDYDLIEIDTTNLAVRSRYSAVGTLNFGAALRPGTEEVWVANTEARNQVRYVTALRGHAFDNRVTRVNTGANANVTSFDLNPGIDYSILPNPAALSSSLAQPVALAWDASGSNLYVAAFGTDRVGVIDSNGIVQSFVEVGDSAGTKVDSRHKRGPHGLAMHPTAGLLYVLNRLSNSITAIDTNNLSVLFELGLPDPTPVTIKEGRGFLYDAKLSGNGTFSCASCHVSGDIDGLAWDLGDPSGSMFEAKGSAGRKIDMHPMKGPMTTQTLKGLRGIGALHWRADKPRVQDFNGAFDSLMGKTTLSSSDIDAMATFIESISYPPNPNRTLTNELPSQSAKDGEDFFTNVVFSSKSKCIDCHSIGSGTDGRIFTASALLGNQGMKTAQLRNLYKRLSFLKTPAGRKGGFGLTHEGDRQDPFDHLSQPGFGPLASNTLNKQNLSNFVLAWDTGIPPAVGFQITVDQGSFAAGQADINALVARAQAGDVDLIVKGQVAGAQRGFLYDITRQLFDPATVTDTPKTLTDLENWVQAGNAVLTFTGVPLLTGRRLGIDRDTDGVLDSDEGAIPYGLGTAGCNGIPTLSAGSEPRINNTSFSLVGQNAPVGAFGILGISTGSSNLTLLGVKVLIDITQPSSLFLDITADIRGELAVGLPIPDDTNLVGLTVFNQLYWVDTCGPQGLSASQGLKVTISQ
jgi:DNA-binding beta-propeller fold protein YncE